MKVWIDYDAVVATCDCRYCKATGRAPSSDGHTPCGFCDPRLDPAPVKDERK